MPDTLFSCVFLGMGHDFLPMVKNHCPPCPASSDFRQGCADRGWYKKGRGWKIYALHQKDGPGIRKCFKTGVYPWPVLWRCWYIDWKPDQNLLYAAFYPDS